MENSVKIKYSVERKLIKVFENTFDEDDIKSLLIDIREDVKGDSIIREICDFVAHPERDKGLFHTKINNRYAKMLMFEKQMDKLRHEDALKTYKSEREWSDAVLNYINPIKIDSKLFEIIILNGIDDIDNSLFVKYYKTNRKSVKNLIGSKYVKKGDFYFLNDLSAIKELDEYLKFIRGTIQYSPVFSHMDLEKSLNKSIKLIVNKYNLNKDLITGFSKNIKQVVVCILCWLHDTSFKFFDGEIGKCYLSIYKKSDSDKGKLSIISSGGRTVFPIFISEIDCTDYISDSFICENMQPSSVFNAVRKGEILTIE